MEASTEKLTLEAEFLRAGQGNCQALEFSQKGRRQATNVVARA